MKTLLICHKGAPIDQVLLARWLHATTNLVGIIELDETRGRFWKRVRREVARVGWLRFADVLAFRLYYRLFLAAGDRDWERKTIEDACETFDALPSDLPVLATASPNSAEAKAFIEERRPDATIARCKHLLKRDIFEIPTLGTFVMHPGICPEYRNAHGCFWALANDDRERVGMTLLRIDEGVDTGPVYGYFSYDIDEVAESHIVIQARVVTENLPEIRAKLEEISAGTAPTVDTRGRPSGTWGQPWLSRYLRWKRRARRARARGGATPADAQ